MSFVNLIEDKKLLKPLIDLGGPLINLIGHRFGHMDDLPKKPLTAPSAALTLKVLSTLIILFFAE